jgi:spore germination protein YaaH
MAEKMNAVREADVGGVAVWKLGQEPADFWPLLNLNSK